MNKILKFEEFINESKDKHIDVDDVFDKHKKDELCKVDAKYSYELAKEMLGDENTKSIYGSEEDFSKRYDEAQKSAKENGKYQRGEMPVINNSNFKGSKVGKEDNESAPRTKEMNSVLDSMDVNDEKLRKGVLSNQVLAFKFLVANGFIDIDGSDKDLAKKTQLDLFKDDSLSEKWLSGGGGPKESSDKVKAKDEMIPVKKLKPIQEQIFVAKSIKMASKCDGDIEKMNWLLKPDEKSPYTIVSKDMFILDGHHRWLGAYLIDPNTKMKCVVIDMNCEDLLELTNKFTGAIGNKPNKTA